MSFQSIFISIEMESQTQVDPIYFYPKQISPMSFGLRSKRISMGFDSVFAVTVSLLFDKKQRFINFTSFNFKRLLEILPLLTEKLQSRQKATYYLIDTEQKITVKISFKANGEKMVSFIDAFTKQRVTCFEAEMITLFELKKTLVHNLSTLVNNKLRFIQFFNLYADICMKYNVTKLDDYKMIKPFIPPENWALVFYRMDLESLFHQIPPLLYGNLTRTIRSKRFQ